MSCMLHNLKTFHNGPSLLLRRIPTKYRRLFSSQKEDTSSKAVRQRFLDYFVKKHGHTFIRSSPVVPFCDPTVAFVNAGMNQFKGVFLGQTPAPCKSAANTQKCIRVGGKHNDLAAVGVDSYHHTFFEMMGNWSFGDYFKKEACELAWNLLTGPYRIAPNRLYVTYFGGDVALKLEPDTETKEIWRSIGVPPERIIPFGLADNLWEMGPSGPCGPCTEIHIDHVSDRQLAADRVNRGHSDLTELWNLVFIQYNRLPDGTLIELPQRHVDTGMGFERLLALLQGKQSNYDTDLFVPIFQAIEKASHAKPYAGLYGSADKTGLDTAYRILADHARMVTVALTDGMFPDQNHKLRRVLRTALNVSKRTFRVDRGLLTELTNHVAESLGETYPSIPARLPQVQAMIRHEERLLEELQSGAAEEWGKLAGERRELKELNVVEMPGLVRGYLELQQVLKGTPPDSPPAPDPLDSPPPPSGCADTCSVPPPPCPAPRLTALPTPLAYKLYDTYGVNPATIAKLAAIEKLDFDVAAFDEKLSDNRNRTKGNASRSDNSKLLQSLEELKITKTDDSFKYVYRKELHYMFPELECTVLALVKDGELREKVMYAGKERVECGIVLDRSMFYSEAGGQESDRGWLRLESGADFKIEGAERVGGHLVHTGYIEDGNLHVGDVATLELDFGHRLGNMRNHTATHLVNAALRKILTATCQRSSHVTTDGLTFDFAVYGEVLTLDQVGDIEATVNDYIKAKSDVRRRTVSAGEMLTLDHVTLLPGETYPEQGVHLIEIEAENMLTSREPCCGTHVLNTTDLEEFCILSIKSVGSGVKSMKAITGPNARQALRAGRKTINKVTQMTHKVDSHLDPAVKEPSDGEALGVRLAQLKRDLAESAQLLPHVVRVRCLRDVDVLAQRLREGAKSSLRESLETEMAAVLNTNVEPFLVHCLSSQSLLDTTPLQKATRLCKKLPVLLLLRSDGTVKARCVVPEESATAAFNAQLWMQPVMEVFRTSGSPPKGQNPEQVYNMKQRKFPDEELNGLLEEALVRAYAFAKANVKAKPK